MVKKELIERSPLRILENSTQGGLGKGNLGAIAARKGVGKTACLVHIATDQLFQDKQVIHVSFSADTRHIVDWYEDIFGEIVNKAHLEAAMNVHDDIIRRRIIMNFSQEGIRLPRIINSLNTLIRDGHFSADCIVVDGYDFSKIRAEELREIRQFAQEQGLEIWFSASLGSEEPKFDERGVPELLQPVFDEFSILVCLLPKKDHIHLQLVKDHESEITGDPHLKLDAKSLLIAREG